MVFYAALNSISIISQRQLTLLMSFLGLPVLGWVSEVSCPRTFPRKTQRIQCGSNTDPWITSQTPYHRATQETPPPPPTCETEKWHQRVVRGGEISETELETPFSFITPTIYQTKEVSSLLRK